MQLRLLRTLLIAVVGAALCVLTLYTVATCCNRQLHRLEKLGRPHEALPYTRVAFLLWPSQANRIHYAYTLYQGKTPSEIGKAAALMRRVNWDDPNLPGAAYSLAGSLRMIRQDYDGANQIMQLGLSRCPREWNLWWVLAQAKERQARWADAVEADSRALQYMPLSFFTDRDVHEVHLHRMNMSFALGDWRKGMSLAKESEAAFPHEAVWIGCYASSAEDAGEYATAAEAWQRYFEVRQSKPAAQVCDMCRAFGKMRKPDSGEKYLSITPLSPFALHYCRAALYAYADPARAHQELLEAEAHARSDRQRRRAQLLVAASLTWIGRPEQSLSELRQFSDDQMLGVYPHLYAWQAEMLISPGEVPHEIEEELKSGRVKHAPRFAVECQDILSGRQLRMPRFLPLDGASSHPTGDRTPDTGA